MLQQLPHDPQRILLEMLGTVAATSELDLWRPVNTAVRCANKALSAVAQFSQPLLHWALIGIVHELGSTEGQCLRTAFKDHIECYKGDVGEELILLDMIGDLLRRDADSKITFFSFGDDDCMVVNLCRWKIDLDESFPTNYRAGMLVTAARK